MEVDTPAPSEASAPNGQQSSVAAPSAPDASVPMETNRDGEQTQQQAAGEENSSDTGQEKKKRRRRFGPAPGEQHPEATQPVPFMLPQLNQDQLVRLRQAQQLAVRITAEFVTGVPMPASSTPFPAAAQEILKKQQEKQSLYQAMQLLARVYVGNIHTTITEADLLQTFSPFGHINNINLNHETSAGKVKSFAFVEYDVPESASIALETMAGYMLGGRSIKVGRPNNAPMAMPYMDGMVKAAEEHNRVYISSINKDVTPDDLKHVVEACGPLKRLVLVPGTEGKGGHRGYGWAEFESQDGVNEALHCLNMLDVGEQWLRVCKGISCPEDALAMYGLAAPAGEEQTTKMAVDGAAAGSSAEAASADGTAVESTAEGAGQGQTSAKEEAVSAPKETADGGVSIKGTAQRFMIMQKLAERTEERSPVLVLRNMVTVGDVDDELEGEIKGECEKHGEVKSIVIHQPEKPAEANSPVNVYVAFADAEAAGEAQKVLNGRYFAGRMVTADRFNQARFDNKDYDRL